LTERKMNLDDFESSSHHRKNVDSVISGIAITHVITGILTIPTVYSIFTSAIMQGPWWYSFLMMLEGSALSVTIPLYIILGVAIWLVREWAWKIAVITNVLCMILNIFGQIVLLAILNIILLLALNNTDVRDAL
jgi:hypothetical protein